MGATRILSTQTPQLFREAVQIAAQALIAGEVVVLPTETVYGLAANALNPAAVRKIYEIKGRPAHNPIIVHVSDRAMAQACAGEWNDTADRLARQFWPGPLTIVVPKAASIPEVVTAGGATVGLRCPGHPFMRAVIELCGFPLAAPSANPANCLSPTIVEHVLKGFGDKLSLIVDGGACNVGIESTVVDVTTGRIHVLRPGIISREELEAAAAEGSHDAGNLKTETVLRSPGQLPRHYAPKARLLLLEWGNEKELVEQLQALRISPAKCHLLAHRNIPLSGLLHQVAVVPEDPEAYARALYAELHRCDEEGAEVVVVELPPDTSRWQGIRDRLKRAATPAA